MQVVGIDVIRPETLQAGTEVLIVILERAFAPDLAAALGDEVNILAHLGALQDLAEGLLALAPLVVLRTVHIANAREERGLQEAGLEGPARPLPEQ